jgi:hypothetical protein
MPKSENVSELFGSNRLRRGRIGHDLGPPGDAIRDDTSSPSCRCRKGRGDCDSGPSRSRT